jgi:plasmid maintenance system antidote protein VapI
MAPRHPRPDGDNLRQLLRRVLDRVGSRARLANRLGIREATLQRMLDGQEEVSDAIFLQCVDVLYEARDWKLPEKPDG